MSSIIFAHRYPSGWIMWMFYRVIQNYGLTLWYLRFLPGF
jgi:hypothetical protein